MVNHPNRSRGRPRKEPEDSVRAIKFTLSPEVREAVDRIPSGTRSARVDEILRAALIDPSASAP